MPKKEWEFRYVSLSVLIGIIFGVAAWFASSMIAGPPSPKADFMCGLLSSMVASILTMQVLQSRTLSDVEATARKAMEIGTNALKIGSVNAALAEKAHGLSKLSPLVQRTMSRALDEAINAFKLDAERHSVTIPSGRSFRRPSYEFWQYLELLQSSTRRRITARVTHSSEVDVFYSKDTRDTIGPLQSKFCEKGRMFRLFVDVKPPSEDRIRKYLDIISDIPSAVSCAYLNLSSHELLLDTHNGREFCIEDETRYCAEWQFNSAGEITHFVLSMDSGEYDRNLLTWASSLMILRNHNYRLVEVERKFADQLESLRTMFIKRCDDRRWSLAPLTAISDRFRR
ncbi:MAG TPA: hypothetical protein VF619_08725 [Allosphingosinicella sp.]|jgi:hypothetical protein